MLGGTDLVGSVVCTQQVGKAEETQSVGSVVHAVGGISRMHIW